MTPRRPTVMATLRSFPVVVEVWGWDEAFVGASTDDPEQLARALQARVLAETRLSCAVGIGETKLQAKTATGFAKPGGIARLTRATWIETMGDRPVTAVWGIGARTAQRLQEAGIRTVLELARADHEDLARRFGPAIGPHLRILGLGGDDAPVVDTPFVPRSRSREETFTRDIADPVEIADHVRRLAVDVTDSVVADGRRVTHVAVKVRTATFFTRTKISKLPESTTDPAVVARVASPCSAASTSIDRCGCSASGWCSNRRRDGARRWRQLALTSAIAPRRRPRHPARISAAHCRGSRAEVSISTSPRAATARARRGRPPRHRRTGRDATRSRRSVIGTSQVTLTTVRSTCRSARRPSVRDRLLPHDVFDDDVVAGAGHRRAPPGTSRRGCAAPSGRRGDAPSRPRRRTGSSTPATRRRRARRRSARARPSAGPAGGADHRPARRPRRPHRRPAWPGRCCSCRRSDRRRATPPIPADPRTPRKPTGTGRLPT